MCTMWPKQPSHPSKCFQTFTTMWSWLRDKKEKTMWHYVAKKTTRHRKASPLGKLEGLTGVSQCLLSLSR